MFAFPRDPQRMAASDAACDNSIPFNRCDSFIWDEKGRCRWSKVAPTFCLLSNAVSKTRVGPNSLTGETVRRAAVRPKMERTQRGTRMTPENAGSYQPKKWNAPNCWCGLWVRRECARAQQRNIGVTAHKFAGRGLSLRKIKQYPGCIPRGRGRFGGLRN